MKKIFLLFVIFALALNLSGCFLLFSPNNSRPNYQGPVFASEFEFTAFEDGYAVTGVENYYYITDVTIPAEHDGLPVVAIGKFAFSSCNNLKNVTIPASVKKISDQAFVNSPKLSKLTVDSGNTVFESVNNCVIEKATNTLVLGCGKSIIPNTVKVIGPNAFHGSDILYSISIPYGVTTIEYEAFRNCCNLTSVTIPDSVTEIGEYTFAECKSLNNMCLSNSLTIIKSGTFYNCNGFTSLDFLPPGISVIDSNAFRSCDGFTELIIPDTVNSIGGGSFSECKSLKRVYIPKTVGYVGKAAFQGCGDLTEICCETSRGPNWSKIWDYFSNAMVYWDVPKDEFHKFPETLRYLEHTITGIGTFSGQDLIIPEEINGYAITTITDYAFFGCHTITSATIPNTVNKIQDCAFNDCKYLKTITIPASVIVIGKRAFDGCDNLTDIYCEAESKPGGWSENWLGDCKATVHWGA